MPWIFPFHGIAEEINEKTRANKSGSFIQLTDGYTHYEIGGSKNGLPVVLVHGFSVPYFIWDPTFEFLIKNHFRVLRYDLFGRGFSDRPKLRYDIATFCKQLRDLIDILGFEQFNLIGLSMGGIISAFFTVLYPERVRRLVLVDPAGAKPVTIPKLLQALTTPGFGEFAMGLLRSKKTTEANKSDFYDPVHVKVFVKKYLTQFKYKGSIRALLSTAGSGMLGNFTEVYEQIGRMQIPVALFWGGNDKTVPLSQSGDIRAAIPQISFHLIKDCGHIPHYEKPEEVNPLLLEFLKK